MIDWQQAHGYPLTFFTEASLDLADDPELMQLMVDANIIDRVHRHRKPQRRVAAGDQEVSERAQGRHDRSRRCTRFRMPVWRSGAA